MKVNKLSWMKVFGLKEWNNNDHTITVMVSFLTVDYPYESVKDFVECWTGLLLFQMLGIVLSAILFLDQQALIWKAATHMHDTWYHMLFFIVWAITVLAIFCWNTYTIIAGQRLYVKLKPRAS